MKLTLKLTKSFDLNHKILDLSKRLNDVNVILKNYDFIRRIKFFIEI